VPPVTPPPEIEALQAERRRALRFEPPSPIADAGEAAAFVRERRIVCVSASRTGLPALTEAIAGRPLPGSWMADPEVHRVYEVLCDLDERGKDLVSGAIVNGKRAMVDASLAPAVERIASDPRRREGAVRVLPAASRALLARIDAEGAVRADRLGLPADEVRAARLALERALLVVSDELHTESGYHTAVVRPWSASPFARDPAAAAAAARLDLAAAEEALLLAALRSAVVVRTRDARRWFAFAPARIDALEARGLVARIGSGRTEHLACRTSMV